MPGSPWSLPPGTARRPVMRTVLVVGVLGLLLGACDGGADETVVQIGAGSTTEQQILAALTSEVFAREDVTAEIVPDLGDTSDVRDAALDGQIDVYWDYSGATWALSLGLTAPPIDPQASYEAVAAEEAANGLRWVAASDVDARLAFFVGPELLGEGEAATLSWLAGQVGQVEGAVCADEEYLSAPSGYAYLADTYAIAPGSVTTRAAGEEAALRATADDECLAGLASATSGLARQLDLVPLTDDQGVFPALVLAPVVRTGGPGAAEEVQALMRALAEELTTETLAELNAEALEGTPIDELASTFVASRDLRPGADQTSGLSPETLVREDQA